MIKHERHVLRRIVFFFIAAMLVTGPVTAASVPCPATALVTSDDCTAAMVKKPKLPSDKCLELCTSLAAAICTLPNVPAPILARIGRAIPNWIAEAQLIAIAVELNTPPPRTIA